MAFSFDGRLEWRGAPLSPHYPSMQGQLHVDVGAGQFLKADPGAAKLLGVLSLQSLPRRLTLDFRDLFSAGFAFDFVRGDVEAVRSVASLLDELETLWRGRIARIDDLIAADLHPEHIKE